jgi:hypothetical protein
MFNNASFRQFVVTGTTSFSFSALGATVRMQPAIWAWAATGATLTQVLPDPGNDGFGLLGYKVTNLGAGMWHYEYALYNQNLDRAIQSFSVPLGSGVNVSNVGFHAPPQHPGWANDGTLNDQGYSSTPWTVTQDGGSITWNTETFAQNQNANAIRWGTLYNFRFDANQPPQSSSATVGFFKTGSPITAAIQGPAGGTPTPTPTASSTPTPTATATPTSTATATPTPSATATPSSCSVTHSGCGGIVTIRPRDFIISVTDAVDPATVQASDFTVNGIPADSFLLSNGNATITFHFNSTPVNQVSNVMHIPAGAFDCVTGPVAEFTCAFRYITRRLHPTPQPRPNPQR